MEKIRTFHVTTDRSPEGIEYSFVDGIGERLYSVTIKSDLNETSTEWVIANLKHNLHEFLEWATLQKGLVLVELSQNISFDAFWLKYDDKIRSSKKRSQRLWDKLNAADQARAYYFIPVYNKNRGQAEKKYCETYLNAELWNN